MEIKQNTIGEIIETENQLCLNAADHYGEYFKNAFEFNRLLQDFLKSANPDRWIFAMFLGQVRKHHLLAIFSAVRLHHIQAMLDLRQVLEAGSCAAYAIANPGQDGFADFTKDGLVDATQELKKKRYAWLDKNYKAGSDALKKIKDLINSSTAHSNIIYAHKNFRFDDQEQQFVTPFFDFEDEYYVKCDLWQIANIAMGLMDLFFGVNKSIGVINFVDDFIPRLKALEADNLRLKTEMMSSQRFVDAQKLASK